METDEDLDDFSDYDTNQFSEADSDATLSTDFDNLEISSDSDQEECDPATCKSNRYVTCYAESRPLFRMFENHQRTSESDEKFTRYLDISFDCIENGMQVITEETAKRTKWWSYVPLHQFSEEIVGKKPRVLKRDIFDGYKIFRGSTRRNEAIPSYFRPLFHLAHKDLLSFSDFAESVDYTLQKMITFFKHDLSEEYSDYSKMQRLGSVESEEFDESLKDIDSHISRLLNCESELKADFEYLFQAKYQLKTISMGVYDHPNARLSTKATVKLCRLRDFCNHGLTLYMNTVLKTLKVMNSCLLVSNKLWSLSN